MAVDWDSNTRLILGGAQSLGGALERHGEKRDVEAKRKAELGRKLRPEIQALYDDVVAGRISGKEAGIRANLIMNGQGVGATQAPQSAPRPAPSIAAPASQDMATNVSFAPGSEGGLSQAAMLQASQLPRQSIADPQPAAPAPAPAQSQSIATAGGRPWTVQDAMDLERAVRIRQGTQPRGLTVEDRIAIVEAQNKGRQELETQKQGGRKELESQKEEGRMNRAQLRAQTVMNSVRTVQEGKNATREDMQAFTAWRDAQKEAAELQRLKLKLEEARAGRLSKEEIEQVRTESRALTARINSLGRVMSGYPMAMGNPVVEDWVAEQREALKDELDQIKDGLWDAKPAPKPKQSGAQQGAGPKPTGRKKFARGQWWMEMSDGSAVPMR